MARKRAATLPASDRATVAAGFVTGLLSGLAARGIDRAVILREAGIRPAAIAGPRSRVPLPAYAALYDAAIRASGDEGFGLFELPLRPGTFEFLCRAVIGSRRLDEALDRASRFLALVLPQLHVAIRRDGETARLTIAEVRRLRPDPADPRRVFAFEWLLRLLHALACWLAGRNLALDAVSFPYPRPAHAADYSLIYTEHSSFGAEALVATLDAALLELPVRRDDTDLAAFLDGAPGKITMLYRRDRELARSLRAILADALPQALDLAQAARELHVSPRTLHRRLQDEGANFRAVKDALRRDLALARLAKPGMSVARIAADLGYSEPSAFFRAFQGWTGEAPSAWRRRFARRR
ncbi:MAG TPA: AraC family transcriptional regulator [Usitatibacteraceae bacterium]|nr:AraC family transcriptional regulator [Usitatibacteraceae bacterium]